MSSPFDGLPEIFVSTFGQAVSVAVGDGEYIETTGIYQPRSVDALGVSQPEAMLHLKADDAANISDGTLVQIGSDWFRARVAEPDGKGMVPFRLEASDGP